MGDVLRVRRNDQWLHEPVLPRRNYRNVSQAPSPQRAALVRRGGVAVEQALEPLQSQAGGKRQLQAEYAPEALYGAYSPSRRSFLGRPSPRRLRTGADRQVLSQAPRMEWEQRQAVGMDWQRRRAAGMQ